MSTALLENCGRSHSYRFEFRVNFALLKKEPFKSEVVSMVNNLGVKTKFVYYKTDTYFKYLDFMLATIFQMLPFFSGHGDPYSLSGVLILTFMLNSLVHAPPSTLVKPTLTGER